MDVRLYCMRVDLQASSRCYHYLDRRASVISSRSIPIDKKKKKKWGSREACCLVLSRLLVFLGTVCVPF